jgi:hypothetical protein
VVSTSWDSVVGTIDWAPGWIIRGSNPGRGGSFSFLQNVQISCRTNPAYYSMDSRINNSWFVGFYLVCETGWLTMFLNSWSLRWNKYLFHLTCKDGTKHKYWNDVIHIPCKNPRIKKYCLDHDEGLRTQIPRFFPGGKVAGVWSWQLTSN